MGASMELLLKDSKESQRGCSSIRARNVAVHSKSQQNPANKRMNHYPPLYSSPDSQLGTPRSSHNYGAPLRASSFNLPRVDDDDRIFQTAYLTIVVHVRISRSLWSCYRGTRGSEESERMGFRVSWDGTRITRRGLSFIQRSLRR